MMTGIGALNASDRASADVFVDEPGQTCVAHLPPGARLRAGTIRGG